jgi:hypothetical protein
MPTCTDGPASLDICYYPGSELARKGAYSVTDLDGNPVDLSAAELEMQIKYKPEDPLTRAVIVLKTTDSTLTVGGASNNEVTLHGVHQIDDGNYHHDLLRKVHCIEKRNT